MSGVTTPHPCEQTGLFIADGNILNTIKRLLLTKLEETTQNDVIREMISQCNSESIENRNKYTNKESK